MKLRAVPALLFACAVALLPKVASASEPPGTMQSAIDSIPYVIFYKDLNGVYRGGNKAWERLVGKPRAEVLGTSDFDLFPQDVAESFRAYDQAMLDSGKSRANEEWLTYPDGQRTYVETTKIPWIGEDGSVLGVLGMCREISAPE